MAVFNLIPSIKTFAPPEMSQKTIVTLWEEEFNRNGNKQMRVSLSKMDGEDYVGPATGTSRSIRRRGNQRLDQF